MAGNLLDALKHAGLADAKKAKKIENEKIRKSLEKNKFYIVPGIDIKIARFLSKISPSNIVAKVTYRIQKRKIER